MEYFAGDAREESGYWAFCGAKSAGDTAAETVFMGKSVEGDSGVCG